MNELAPVTVGAVMILMILLAEFSLISGRNMLLFLQLMLSVSKRAHFAIGARLSFNPAFAKLSFDFNFIILR